MNKINLAVFCSVIVFFISSELSDFRIRYITDEVVFGHVFLFFIDQNMVKFIVYTGAGYFMLRFVNKKQLLIIGFISIVISIADINRTHLFTEMATIFYIISVYIGGIIPAIGLFTGYKLKNHHSVCYKRHL